MCVEPPSRAILRRRRPESASRRTRCQRGRLGAGSRRLARVGPGRWQGGPDGTGRLGPGLAELAGPEGSGSPRRQKAGGGGERSDENSAGRGSRIAVPRLRQRRRADQGQSPQESPQQPYFAQVRRNGDCAKSKAKRHRNFEQVKHRGRTRFAAGCMCACVVGAGAAGVYPGRAA